MKAHVFLPVRSILIALGGCVGSAEGPVAPSALHRAGNISTSLAPEIAARLFSAKSLYIKGLHSSWTIVSAGSPNAAGTQTQDSNANYSTEVRLLKSDGSLISGGGRLDTACYIGSDRSEIYIGYIPGGTKSDSYTCGGDPSNSVKRAYSVSYSSASTYDGKTLNLDGTMTISQSVDWNLGRPNEEKVKVIHQTATIQFDGKACSVVSYLSTDRETSTTPESASHYASADQVDGMVRKQPGTKCIVY